MNGVVACPALLALGAAALAGGYRAYRLKEIGPPTAPFQLPGRWWVWTLLFLMGLALAMVLIAWLARQVPAVLI
jgi:hypothetical protein